MEWLDLEFFNSDKFKQITRFLKEEEDAGKIIYPPKEDILNAFVLTPFSKVKVLVFGQDPYHTSNPQYANGLAFSSRDGTTPLPKSLGNIFRELQKDTGIERTNGDLTDWAEQGVLLLNTSLTVVKGQAGSHSHIGWGRLVKDVISCINENRENVVFILWGAHAQQYEMFIDQSKHYIIKSAHPSPLSAHRGFFGSKPFSKTNKYLLEHNIEPIRW